MKKFDKPILVTRPYLPDLEDFKKGCGEIWANQWLTNNGPMLQRFQAKLSDYFCVPESNLALFNNGTLALELGYYAMGLAGGDVITTPFTFVATSHALKRIGATPVFADIDPETLCLDPAACEKSRRYFYPLLTDFAPYVAARGSCLVAEDVARRILTLPTYFGLPLADVKAIGESVLSIAG